MGSLCEWPQRWFHARLRLGRPRFQEAIHVPGDLMISNPTIEYLCNVLRVDGDLDLTARALKRSPSG